MAGLTYELPPNEYVMSSEEEDCVTATVDKFMALAVWRNTYAQQWDEVAQVIFPEHRNTFYYGTYNFPGQKKTDQQIDASGMIALWRFAAICDSLLTPANMKWHTLTATNPDVMKDRDTRLWFDKVTAALFKRRYAATANFAGQNYANFLQLGAFGTMGMFIDEYEDLTTGLPNGLRYHAVPLGELFLTQNHQGQIDGFVRWMRLTARQVYRMFGPERFPRSMEGSLKQNSEYLYNILHHVCLRSDYDPKAIFSKKGRPWASYYVAVDGRMLLREGGYWTFPLAAGRYLQGPQEVYGRGPAMMVLPSLKTINAIKRAYLKTGHRIGDPILLTADDGLLDGATLRPGSEIKGGINPEGRKLVDVLPTGQLNDLELMLNKEGEIINDAFLVRLFQILEESNGMSATEVIERVNEKGILLAPTMGRQQSEYIGSLVPREIDIGVRQGWIDPMPPALREAQGEYEIVYTSPLAKMIRSQEVAGAMRTVEMVKELAAVSGDQSVLYPFAFNRMVPGIADNQSVPEEWMATPQEIRQKVQAAAQAAAQKAQAEAAPGQAALLNAQTKAQQAQGAQAPGTFAPINLQQPQAA